MRKYCKKCGHEMEYTVCKVETCNCVCEAK